MGWFWLWLGLPRAVLGEVMAAKAGCLDVCFMISYLHFLLEDLQTFLTEWGKNVCVITRISLLHSL